MSETIREDMTVGHLAQMAARWGVTFAWAWIGDRRVWVATVQNRQGVEQASTETSEGVGPGPAIVEAFRLYRNLFRKGQP